MPDKKVLIICQSIHHGNTMKVAQAMAEVFGAAIKKPSEVSAEEIAGYDLIGFGSGIYNGRHHRGLFDLAGKLPDQNHKQAFIFSTASFRVKSLHEPLRKILNNKNFDIVGEFMCKGFIDYSFIKYIFGGLNKGRPNENDIKEAEDFASKIKESLLVH